MITILEELESIVSDILSQISACHSIQISNSAVGIALELVQEFSEDGFLEQLKRVSALNPDGSPYSTWNAPFSL